MQNINTISKLIENVNSITSSLTYVANKEENKFKELVDIYNELFKQTKSVSYLIEICRLEKKMYSKYTSISKEAAKKAFLTKPVEKTLFFFLATNIINSSPEKLIPILEETFNNIKEPNLLAIKDLYMGSLLAVKGNYLDYNRLISKSKDNYTPGTYWQLQLVVNDFNLGSKDNLFLGKEYNLILPRRINIEYVISASCDQKYFDTYAEYFLKSIFKNTKKPLVHLYVVNPQDLKSIKNKIKDWVGQDSENVIINTFECPTDIDYRPISAVMRLLAINSLLNQYQKPVFFTEIDAVILKDLSELIKLTKENNACQLIRIIGSYLPWQRFTCGLGLYLYNQSSINSSQLLSQYIKGIFNNSNKHWWADQCALEASIRFSILTDYKYNYYSPNFKITNEYIITPTGADLHEKKLATLRSYIN